MTMKTTCHVCLLPVSYPVCFVLKPCNHTACVKCFHQSVPASHALQCPCSTCQKWITTSTLMEVTCTERSDAQMKKHFPTTFTAVDTEYESSSETLIPIQEVIHFEPDEQMDPFRHWASKKPDLYSGFLYVAFRNNDEEASFYRTNFKALNSTVFVDDNSCDDLIKIFARVLHPLLFRKDFFGSHNDESMKRHPTKTKPSQEYVFPSPMHQERQKLALRSLCALSSGKIMSPEEQQELFDSSLANHKRIKRKAIDCAMCLAQELLSSESRKFNKLPQWGKSVMSSIQKNEGKNEESVPILDLPCVDEYRCEESNVRIPYMFGILLLGAALIVGQ